MTRHQDHVPLPGGEREPHVVEPISSPEALQETTQEAPQPVREMETGLIRTRGGAQRCTLSTRRSAPHHYEVEILPGMYTNNSIPGPELIIGIVREFYPNTISLPKVDTQQHGSILPKPIQSRQNPSSQKPEIWAGFDPDHTKPGGCPTGAPAWLASRSKPVAMRNA